MIHIVKHLKTKEELLLTEDFQEAVNANINQPDTWVDTINADIEDGSSPHTRGTFDRGMPIYWRWRFIPTYAGNINVPVPRPVGQTVHPHIRGEHYIFDSLVPKSVGSSPHTRGT